MKNSTASSSNSCGFVGLLSLSLSSCLVHLFQSSVFHFPFYLHYRGNCLGRHHRLEKRFFRVSNASPGHIFVFSLMGWFQIQFSPTFLSIMGRKSTKQQGIGDKHVYGEEEEEGLCFFFFFCWYSLLGLMINESFCIHVQMLLLSLSVTCHSFRALQTISIARW